MKILYLTQVFEVGTDPGSERHFYFCKYLVRHGHASTAITSNVDYKKATVRIPGEKGTVKRRIDGVDIHYVYSYPNFRGSFFRRFIYFLSYFFSSIREVFRIEKPDAIYAVSTPLTVGLLGYLLSRLRGVPFVFEVTDVWPDAPIACGVIKNRAVIAAARWVEMFCYRKAAHIVALTEGIRDNIVAKGIAPGKVSVITNGVDFSLFKDGQDAVAPATIRDKYGFGNRFVAMYMGAHGAYNALDTIIDVAHAVAADPRFLFVFVGDGDVKAHLQARVAALGLANVQFIAPIPRSESPALLSAADAFLLPNRKGEFFTGNLPNKLFDFLASARPIIVAGAGETAAVIEAAGCGTVVEAEDGAAMAQALRDLAALSPEAQAQMGAAGKAYVTRHYDRDTLSAKFLDILQGAVRRRQGESMSSGFGQPQYGVDWSSASGVALRIEAAHQGDIPKIAILHRQVFPGFFLSTMGEKFLEELYSGFMNHPGGLMIVARNGEEVVGFAAGATEPESFFPTLRKRRGAAFLAKALPAILRNPLPVLRKLYSAVFYRGDTPHETASGALLSSIGVATALQGSGLAEQLLLAFEARVAAQGGNGIYLTTDADNNDRVNAFYRKKGYAVDSRFMQHGRRPMFRYVKRIVQENDYGK